MTSGVPAQASVDLFNKLIRLPGSNKQEIGQIEFRLRALQKKRPNDLRTTVALLQALTMLGKTSEAIETADYLWGQRDWLGAEVQLTILVQLINLAMFDRAKELTARFLEQPELRLDPEFVGSIIHIAVGAGDIALLRTVADWQVFPEVSPRIGFFVEEVRRLGLDSQFKQHQAVVRNIAYGHQSSYLAIFFDAETVELSVYIYVDEPRKERRLLENEIDDALAKYYLEQGVEPGLFVPLITTQVFDISARHAPKAN